MAAPVRRSRRRRSVLRMSLVSAGAGRRELDADRARVAMRTCAKDRAEARMAAGNPRSSAKRGSRRKELSEEVGDGHLPRKKEGPDETGKDVESQRGSFSRTRAVEVDDAEETLDNKEKGVAP